MSLKPLFVGGAATPYSFDGYDREFLTLKGGEVLCLDKVTVPSPASDVDLASFDSFDGYLNSNSRPVVKKFLTGKRPLFLADDGTAGYGTLFGQVVGGTAGQVTGGAQLGPHTATGSGKVTCWGTPGLYAVSLDAVDTTTSTGLVVNNTTLTAGSALYPGTGGVLTPNSSVAVETYTVARFVEFSTNGSLVTTPNYLTQALNSPAGATGVSKAYTFAVIHFQPGV